LVISGDLRQGFRELGRAAEILPEGQDGKRRATEILGELMTPGVVLEDQRDGVWRRLLDSLTGPGGAEEALREARTAVETADANLFRFWIGHRAGSRCARSSSWQVPTVIWRLARSARCG
jgi:hypothetical protein